jgi:putative hemolysin
MSAGGIGNAKGIVGATAAVWAALLVTACRSAPAAGEPADQLPAARANPASVNCGTQGGTLSIQRRGDGGEYGICLFEDNRQCEEWALLRGDCPPGGLKVTGYVTPAARYCAITGWQYRVTGEANTEHEQGECAFGNGETCDAWEYFDGKCTPATGGGRQTYSDPFAYCAAVGTVDLPDERWAGPSLPDVVIQGLIQQGVVAPDAPLEFQQHAVWRCMDGVLVACHFGANLPCLERADTSRTPTVVAAEFCAANPAAEAIPAFVTGRATVYGWGCAEGKPVVLEEIFHADGRGFLAELWHRVTRPEPEADPSTSSLSDIKISHNGRLALLPIDPDNVDPTRELIQSGRFESHGVSVALYEPVGLLPQLLVSGEPDAVESFVKTAREMFVDTGRKHLIAISARLTQLTDSEIRDLGINLFPNSITYSGLLTKDVGWPWDGSIDIEVNQSGAGNILVADESLGLGKALVASQVFTPNGVKAEISDVQHEPIFSIDNYGNVQTDYEDLETTIEVTPVVIDFDPVARVASRVRLDITVKVSLISGEKRTGDVTAPQYSDKSFVTTRVFPADGRTYLVGSFVSDSNIKSRSGVPFLSKIPLVKYLFTQKSTTKSRSYALLTIGVDVLPDDLSSDELLRLQRGSTQPAASTNARTKEKEKDLEDIPAILDQALAPPAPPEPGKAP